MLSSYIELLRSGESLTQGQMGEVVDMIMRGQCQNEEIGQILTQLHNKGETVEELTGAAQAMRNHMNTLDCQRPHVVDTCGTGGSGAGLFNISTAAAFVAAACGTVIAKHGNRKATSNSGSTDVLAELGVAVDRSIEDAERCLNEAGICFCHAPLFHPSVKHVVEVRKQVSHPTIFNLLGPLCNPASVPHQVLGAGRGETQQLLAQALANLGTEHSVVVHGVDGLGEVSCDDATDVCEIQSGQIQVHQWMPADFGLPTTEIADLRASDPTHSASIIRGVFNGEIGSARNIVVINAAAAVWISGVLGQGADLESAASACENAIDEGLALAKLNELVALTNR